MITNELGEPIDDRTISEHPAFVHLKYFHNHDCSHAREVVAFRSYTEGGAHVRHTVVCTESGLEMLYVGILNDDDD